MYKLLAFDLDHTLCNPDDPIDTETLAFLYEAEEDGLKIAIMSGRPIMYIGGLGRQLELKNPIISGENGAYTYYDISFPPKMYFQNEPPDEQKKVLLTLRELINKKFKEKAWIQPNFINFAVFAMDDSYREELVHFMQDYYDNVINDNSYTLFFHPDGSIEIVPPNINKGLALKQIMDYEGITKDEVIAVGNSGNDLAMLRESGLSIGIGYKEADITFDTIGDAVTFLRDKLQIPNSEGDHR